MNADTLSLVKLAQMLCQAGHEPRTATGHILNLMGKDLPEADQEQAIAEIERRMSGLTVKPWEPPKSG